MIKDKIAALIIFVSMLSPLYSQLYLKEYSYHFIQDSLINIEFTFNYTLSADTIIKKIKNEYYDFNLSDFKFYPRVFISSSTEYKRDSLHTNFISICFSRPIKYRKIKLKKGQTIKIRYNLIIDKKSSTNDYTAYAEINHNLISVTSLPIKNDYTAYLEISHNNEIYLFQIPISKIITFPKIIKVTPH